MTLWYMGICEHFSYTTVSKTLEALIHTLKDYFSIVSMVAYIVKQCLLLSG